MNDAPVINPHVDSRLSPISAVTTVGYRRPNELPLSASASRASIRGSRMPAVPQADNAAALAQSSRMLLQRAPPTNSPSADYQRARAPSQASTSERRNRGQRRNLLSPLPSSYSGKTWRSAFAQTIDLSSRQTCQTREFVSRNEIRDSVGVHFGPVEAAMRFDRLHSDTNERTLCRFRDTLSRSPATILRRILPAGRLHDKIRHSHRGLA